jgi:hypothetical protein
MFGLSTCLIPITSRRNVDIHPIFEKDKKPGALDLRQCEEPQ